MYSRLEHLVIVVDMLSLGNVPFRLPQIMHF